MIFVRPMQNIQNIIAIPSSMIAKAMLYIEYDFSIHLIYIVSPSVVSCSFYSVHIETFLVVLQHANTLFANHEDVLYFGYRLQPCANDNYSNTKIKAPTIGVVLVQMLVPTFPCFFCEEHKKHVYISCQP